VRGLTAKIDRTDKLDRLTDERWKAGSTTLRTISFGYDAAGQMTTAADADSEYAYTYDAAGRVTEVDNASTPDAPHVVLTSAYDNLGRRTSLAANVDSTDDFLNGYSYDALGRTTQVTQEAQSGGNAVADKRIDFGYDANGQYAFILRYADLAGSDLVATSDYTYDDAGRLTDLVHAQGTTTLADYSWTYDTNGRLTATSSPDGTSSFTYDATGQLTAADHSYQTDESYAYDATGNRTGGGYTTDGNNHITSDGTYDYDYDAEGNRTRKTEIATGDYVTYTWDHRNRLTDVAFFDDTDTLLKSVHYTYDAFDRLIAKSVDDDGDTTIDRGQSFVYDGTDIVLVADETGSLTDRFLTGPDIDQILAQENGSGDVRWLLADQQGTIRDVAEYDGGTGDTTVVNHLQYDSFGRITDQTDPGEQPRFAYTGLMWDADAELQYSRARWYDPTVGRFLSEDPLSFAAGDVNLTRYVSNAPTNYVDPTGLQQTWAFGAAPGLTQSTLDNAIAVHNGVTPTTGNPVVSSNTGGSWLDDYSNWFNSTSVTAAWSEGAGGLIHTGLNTVVSDVTLASISDATLTTCVVGTSVIVGVGLFVGGELALGVGTMPVLLTPGIAAASAHLSALGALAQTEFALLQAFILGPTGGGLSLVGVGGISATSSTLSAGIAISPAGLVTGVLVTVALMSGNPSDPPPGSYMTPADAIGDLNGVADLVDTTRTNSSYWVERGYTRTHYYLDSNGFQHTVFYNPRTGLYSGGHLSSGW